MVTDGGWYAWCKKCNKDSSLELLPSDRFKCKKCGRII